MKYRKLPVVIEAMKWDGKNTKEILEFCPKAKHYPMSKSLWPSLIVETLEGGMRVMKGGYIIKGLDGDFYTCKAETFENTYEEL